VGGKVCKPFRHADPSCRDEDPAISIVTQGCGSSIPIYPCIKPIIGTKSLMTLDIDEIDRRLPLNSNATPRSVDQLSKVRYRATPVGDG
jgi:hypothetical protein